jgi:hypothetical protein
MDGRSDNWRIPTLLQKYVHEINRLINKRI